MKKGMIPVVVLGMAAVFAACGTETQAPAEAPTATAAPTEEAAPAEGTAQVVELPADVMSHADYVAAQVDDPVKVDVYVQATQSWWDGKITVYAADEDGAYFIYNMTCAEEDAAKLVKGTHILVDGFKGEWSDEVEIVDAGFAFLEGSYIVEKPVDVTALLGKEELIEHQNEYVSFSDLEISAKTDASGNEVAFLYNWDGSGEAGSDLYFDVKAEDGSIYTFTVESYLCGADTDVYKTVEGLQIGDKVDLEGFLYWYEGVNPHITGVTVK